MHPALLVAIGFGSATLGGATLQLTGSEQGPTLKGEIILQRASYCDYSVVQTDRGFAFLDMGAGLVAIASGRWVTGRLTQPGPQTVDIDGRTLLRVRVVAWDAELSQAKARFDRYCDPDWLDIGPENEG